MAIEKISELIFSGICHQDLSLLMEIKGKAIMLCPRCIGLHLGGGLAFAILSVFAFHRLDLNRKGSQVLLIGSFIFLMTDWLLGQLSIQPPTIYSRLFSGLAAGVSCGVLAMKYFQDVFPDKSGVIKRLSPQSILSMMTLITVFTLFLKAYSSWEGFTISLIVIGLFNLFIAVSTILVRILQLMGVVAENYN